MPLTRVTSVTVYPSGYFSLGSKRPLFIHCQTLSVSASTGSLSEDLKTTLFPTLNHKGHKAGAPFPSIKLRYILIPKLRYWGPEHINT